MTNVDHKARDDLQDILNQREYEIYYEDNRSLLEKVWDAVADWFGELLEKLFQSMDPANSLSTFMLTILIIGVGILIGIVVFLVIRKKKRSRQFHKLSPLASTSEKNGSFKDHLQEAEKQSARKRYALAARHMFLALLLYFHEKGWLEAQDWKTNWDYFAELESKDKSLAERFFLLALTFDEVVYGKRMLTEEEYMSFRNEIIVWLRSK